MGPVPVGPIRHVPPITRTGIFGGGRRLLGISKPITAGWFLTNPKKSRKSQEKAVDKPVKTDCAEANLRGTLRFPKTAEAKPGGFAMLNLPTN